MRINKKAPTSITIKCQNIYRRKTLVERVEQMKTHNQKEFKWNNWAGIRNGQRINWAHFLRPKSTNRPMASETHLLGLKIQVNWERLKLMTENSGISFRFISIGTQSALSNIWFRVKLTLTKGSNRDIERSSNMKDQFQYQKRETKLENRL